MISTSKHLFQLFILNFIDSWLVGIQSRSNKHRSDSAAKIINLLQSVSDALLTETRHIDCTIMVRSNPVNVHPNTKTAINEGLDDAGQNNADKNAK